YYRHRTSMRNSVSFAVLRTAVIVVLAGLAGTQAQEKPPACAHEPAQQAATPEQPIFRGGINPVRVDVIVTDRQGNPVSDLKLEDFQIEEDGKPQKPETFRLGRIEIGRASG